MTYQEIMDNFQEELSPTQLEYLTAYLKYQSYRKVAKELNRAESTIRRSLKELRSKYQLRTSSVPSNHLKPVPEVFNVKGYSAYYGPDGERRGHWIKTDRSKDEMYQDLKDHMEELAQELPILNKKSFQKPVESSLLAVYPLGDPHIGLLTYKPETGQNWDLTIAEKTFLPMFDRLVKAAPPCEEALIIDLGDFWHYDAMDQRTVRSGHKVDADGRPSKMVRTGYRILLQMIESALGQHKRVHVKIMPGNHDDLGSIFLRVSLAHVYQNEPRVIVDPSPNVFQYFIWGDNLIGIHHGDKAKLTDLPLVMASDMPEEWGNSKHRYWYVGHFHHDSTRQFAGKELHGCKVETFRSIIAAEAYAHEAGYRAGQDGKVLILHEKHGEIQRHTINIDHLR